MARPRVVRYGATGHRVMRHPRPTQTMTAARAAMTGALARGQGGPFNDPFDPGNGIAGSGPPGSDDLGGMSDDPLGLESRIAELFGMSAPLRPGDFFSPVGPRAGAILGMSGGGRRIADLIAAQHAGPGAGGSNPFAPGGRFSMRGTAGQWASEGDNQSVWSLLKDWQDAKTALKTDQAVYDVLDQAGYFGQNPAEGAAADAGLALDRENVRYAWKKLDDRWKQWFDDRWKQWFGGGQGPTPDWVISPRGRSSLAGGYYPTVAGPSSARLSPVEAARVGRRLRYAARHEGWWGGQWVHLREGPGSGGGGHAPMASQSAVLGGMKHPYDWVAFGHLQR